MLKIIDRYILKEIINPFLFGIAAFTSIFVGTDLLFRVARMITDWGVSFGDAVRVFILSLPEIIVLTFPMSMLLATLLAFGRLSGDSEVIAFKAGGWSFVRMVIPVLIVALLLSFLTVAINETIVPRAQQRVEAMVWEFRHGEKLPKTQKHIYLSPLDRKTGKVDFLFYAYQFDGEKLIMDDVTYQDFEDGHLTRVIRAEEAVWRDGGWEFRNGSIYDLLKEGEVSTMQFERYFDRYQVLGLRRTPREISSSQKDPKKMSYSELKNLIALKREEGRGVDDLLVILHQRFSIPFACFIFALIGAPAGMKSNRTGSSIGLGLSIVIIFIYYLFLTFGSALGQDGIIPPVLGAWIQNIVFGLVGTCMLLKAAR